MHVLRAKTIALTSHTNSLYALIPAVNQTKRHPLHLGNRQSSLFVPEFLL